MKSKEMIMFGVLITVITMAIFYKFIFLGQIPIPGDLLISEYKPWASYSYLGYNPGSYPQKAQYFDTLRQIYPWKTFSLSELQKGIIPLWNPHNFSGSPLLGNSQSAIFYPLNIIYFVFSQPVAWGILVMLQPLLASLGTYLYSRVIGLSRPGSTLAGITYGFCLYTTVFLEYNTINHVTIWVPFLLWTIEKLIKKISITGIFSFVLFTACAAFAGHLQIFGYAYIFISVYLFARIKSSNAKIIPMLILFILSLIIPAIQWLPTAELISLSARVPQEYSFLVEKLLLQPYQLALYVSADLFGNPATYNYRIDDTYPGNAIYVGMIPLLFSLFMVAQKKKNVFVSIFSSVTGIILLLIVRSPLTELFYRIPLPLISTGSPTNAIFLISFSLAILSGLGLDAWVKTTNKIFKKVFAVIFTVFCIIWIVRFSGSTIINTNTLLFSTFIFSFSAILIFLGRSDKSKKYIVMILILVTTLDLFYFFQKFNPFVPREIIFPEAAVLQWLSSHAGYNRFWGYGSAAIEANYSTQYGLYSPEGYDPLYAKHYGELLWAAGNGKLLDAFTNQTRSDAVIAQSIVGQNGIMADSPRKKLLDVLGVKYILDRTENGSTENTFPPEDFRMVYDQDGWKIFENLDVLPRATMVNNYRIYTDTKDFEQIFFNPLFDPKETALLDHAPNTLHAPSEASPGAAIIQSYTSSQITIETHANSAQLLILSDTYFPGWEAFIDGRSSKILKANYALRAVYVPEGSHTVTFLYRPRSFSTGIKTSMIGLSGILLLAIAIKRRKI